MDYKFNIGINSTRFHVSLNRFSLRGYVDGAILSILRKVPALPYVPSILRIGPIIDMC